MSKLLISWLVGSDVLGAGTTLQCAWKGCSTNRAKNAKYSEVIVIDQIHFYLCEVKCVISAATWNTMFYKDLKSVFRWVCSFVPKPSNWGLWVTNVHIYFEIVKEKPQTWIEKRNGSNWQLLDSVRLDPLWKFLVKLEQCVNTWSTGLFIITCRNQ